jgi:hypothetical protein
MTKQRAEEKEVSDAEREVSDAERGERMDAFFAVRWERDAEQL